LRIRILMVLNRSVERVLLHSNKQTLAPLGQTKSLKQKQISA